MQETPCRLFCVITRNTELVQDYLCSRETVRDWQTEKSTALTLPKKHHHYEAAGTKEHRRRSKNCPYCCPFPNTSLGHSQCALQRLALRHPAGYDPAGAGHEPTAHGGSETQCLSSPAQQEEYSHPAMSTLTGSH